MPWPAVHFISKLMIFSVPLKGSAGIYLVVGKMEANK
jgi:hypothetical protein